MTRSNWRKKHPEKRNAEKKRNYARGAKHQWNANQSWSRNDSLKILAHTKTDRELSAEIGRTVVAIQSHRAVLKQEVTQRKDLAARFMAVTGRIKENAAAQ